MPQFCPVTNLYRLVDGRCVLITVKSGPVIAGLAEALQVPLAPLAAAPTEVFLADEDGTLIDADGDPANGMTALVRLPPGTTHEEALAALDALAP